MVCATLTVLLLAIFPLIGSSATRAQSAPEQAGAKPSAAPATEDGNGTQFRLSPGDLIEIKFFYNSELNETARLRPDGSISLSLIGEVLLGGKTVAEGMRQLETLYAEHLVTPSVTIQVREYGARRVYVGGEVERPGTINLTGELTLLAALVEAGGAKRTADLTEVVLIRREGDRAVAQKVSLRKAARDPKTADLRLRPFDVVLVPESRIARLDRWMDQHIRQLIPVTLTGGFSYLFNTGVLR